MTRVSSSCAELPKVMVHVKVCKTHPFPICHAAKVWVRLPLEVLGLSRKAVHKVLQFTQIAVKTDRLVPPAS